MKKNIVISSNTVVSNEQILSNFEPFRKELDQLRKKQHVNINYEEIMSNLHPFSSAIKQLGVYKVEQDRRVKKKQPSEIPCSVNLYRSIPRKKGQPFSKPAS